MDIFRNKIKLEDGSVLIASSTIFTTKLIEAMPDKDSYKALGKGKILYGDDKKMVVDFTNNWFFAILHAFFPFGFMLGSLYVIISELLPNDPYMPEIYFWGPLFALGLFYTIKGLYHPKRIVTFNRLEGNLDVPLPWIRGWSGKTKKLGFNDLCMVYLGMGSRTLAIASSKKSLFSVDTGISRIENTSLLYWYMDKNRPLPWGELFDPYRQADFERRKAEEFPLPLCQSYIDTLEMTQEQQKERDAVWPKGLK